MSKHYLSNLLANASLLFSWWFFVNQSQQTQPDIISSLLVDFVVKKIKR
jgi:hypothetical protein